MPTEIYDGPLGLEALHVWKGFALNNRMDALPHVRLDRITGLHSLPEAEDPRSPRGGRLGEIIYPGALRGKTVTYEGRVIGATLQDMRAHATALRQAFADGTVLGRVDIVPRAEYGDISYFYSARVLALDMDDTQERGPTSVPSPFQRSFVVSMRMGDPRFYVADEQVDFGGNGGVNVAVTNPGTAPAEPSLLLTSPGATVTVERLGNPDARKLVFTDLDLVAGQQLQIEFGTRRVTHVADGADYSPHMDFAESTWWDPGVGGLMPGPTTMRVTGVATWIGSTNIPCW